MEKIIRKLAGVYQRQLKKDAEEYAKAEKVLYGQPRIPEELIQKNPDKK